MEHYVSFHKILDYLKQEQQNSPRLNNFGYGDLVYFVNDSGTTTTYPFLFVTPINISYAENTTTYSLQLIFADIVNTDLSNEKDVVSDMSLEARRFLSVIKRGFLDDKIDVTLPAQATSFFERFNDHVGGVVLNADIIVFEDINACDPYPDPSPSPTATVTPTLTPTPTPTPTPCPITPVSQYLQVELSGCANFKLSLHDDPAFTINANALCDYVISGTAYGDMGTIYTGTESILSGQHQHTFNLNPILQPGECVSGFTVWNIDTSACYCPTIVNWEAPLNFSGLYAWYSLQDTSTITLNGSNQITQLLDKSMNNHTLTPFLNPPSYSAVTTSNLIGYNAMFDTKNYNGLIHNTALKTWSAGTVFIVSARQSTSESIFQVNSGSTTNTLTSTFGINQLSTDGTGFVSFADRTILNYAPFNNNDAYIAGYRAFSTTLGNASGNLYSINNTSVSLTPASTAQNGTTSTYIILGDTLLTGGSNNLPILEAIMYDRALTDVEYNSVILYLKNKYNYSNWT